MRNMKLRTIITLCIFTVCTTLCLLACMYIFVLRPQSQTTSNAYAFQLIDGHDVVLNSYHSSIAPVKNVLTEAELSSFFAFQFNKNFPILLVCITLIMIASSLCLWLWLQKQEQKKHVLIASNIQQLLSSDPNQNDEFYQELVQIKMIMDSYQQDQQRLHAYIMHEQKNMIMLMKARLDKGSNPKLLEDIDHLKYSVDDVLTLFARADSERECIDLAYIVALECDQYRQIYPNLTFHFDEDKTYNILGKAYWFHRTIANLLDNAIKYGEGKDIEVRLKEEKGTIILQVIDHGIGMDKKLADNIFNFHYRINDLQKDGFGIGLSLVAHTCELCDGVVWVKSSPKLGSTFQLSFPLLT